MLAGRHAGNSLLAKAYWSVVSFDGKHKMDNAALTEALSKHPIRRSPGLPRPKALGAQSNAVTKKFGYHYSDVKYEVGDVILPYDNMPTLHPSLNAVEDFIRLAHPDGRRIRSNAVYLWDDEGRARQQWAAAGRAGKAKKYLYTVEYEDADLLHKGDLNHYTDARVFKDAGARDAAAASYWAGELHKEEPPRVELMVRSATVVTADESRAPPPSPWTDDESPLLDPT